MIHAGKLTKRITWQRAGFTSDSFGQRQETWSDLGETYASIRGLTARETERAKQHVPIATHVITIRYQGDATAPPATANPRPKDRGLLGSRVLNVAEVLDWDEAHAELRLLCQEVVSSA